MSAARTDNKQPQHRDQEPASNANNDHRAHPLADRCMSVLRDRSEADQRLVFEHLQRRCQPELTTAAAEIAYYALKRASELLGLSHCPSKKAYNCLRSEQRDPGDFPSATAIRNALGEGSWERATALVDGRPQPDVTTRRLTAKGKRFTTDSVSEILEYWARRADGPLRQQRFLDWAQAEARDPDSPFERVPLTDHTIRRLYGGWNEALAAIGALQRNADAGGTTKHPKTPGAADSDELARPAPLDIDLESMPAATAAQYSEQALFDWLVWFHGRLGLRPGAAMPAADFTELRAQIIATKRAQGEVAHIPAADTITERLGSFHRAQVATGLIEERGTHSRAPYPEDDLLQALAAAAAAETKKENGRSSEQTMVGGLRESTYRHWREQRQRELRRDDPQARLPSVSLLKSRLGGARRRWKVVLSRGQRLLEQTTGSERNGMGSSRQEAKEHSEYAVKELAR